MAFSCIKEAHRELGEVNLPSNYTPEQINGEYSINPKYSYFLHFLHLHVLLDFSLALDISEFLDWDEDHPVVGGLPLTPGTGNSPIKPGRMKITKISRIIIFASYFTFPGCCSAKSQLPASGVASSSGGPAPQLGAERIAPPAKRPIGTQKYQFFWNLKIGIFLVRFLTFSCSAPASIHEALDVARVLASPRKRPGVQTPALSGGSSVGSERHLSGNLNLHILRLHHL